MGYSPFRVLAIYACKRRELDFFRSRLIDCSSSSSFDPDEAEKPTLKLLPELFCEGNSDAGVMQFVLVLPPPAVVRSPTAVEPEPADPAFRPEAAKVIEGSESKRSKEGLESLLACPSGLFVFD